MALTKVTFDVIDGLGSPLQSLLDGKANTSHTHNFPYDVAFFIAGTMTTGNALVGSYLTPRSVFLVSGLTGSYAKAKIAPTGAVAYDIKVNGISVGTVNFAPAASVGTFTFASNQTLSAGDVVDIYTPGTIDGTISDVVITIVGCSTASTCAIV